jgi:hypothetical protein
MAIMEHDSDYVVTGELIFLPVIETSDVANSVATLSKEDEEGATYEADGAKTITKNITIMQKDVDSVRLPRLLEGKNFVWVKEMSRTADPNGDYLYEVGVGAKLSQNYTISGKSGSTPLTFNVTKNDTAVGVDLADFNDSKFLGDLTGASLVTITADYGFDHFAVSPSS